MEYELIFLSMSPDWSTTIPSSTTMSADTPDALANSRAAFNFSADQPCLAGSFITFHLDFGISADCEKADSNRKQKQRRKSVRNVILRGDSTSAAASDGGDQQYLIPILERVSVSTQKADVFFIHIDIQEAADLAVLIAEVRLKRGEFCIELGEEVIEIGRSAREFGRVFGVAAESSWYVNSNIHLDNLVILSEVVSRENARLRSRRTPKILKTLLTPQGILPRITTACNQNNFVTQMPWHPQTVLTL
jgi:hypothetical protein